MCTCVRVCVGRGGVNQRGLVVLFCFVFFFGTKLVKVGGETAEDQNPSIKTSLAPSAEHESIDMRTPSKWSTERMPVCRAFLKFTTKRISDHVRPSSYRPSPY